MLRNIDRPLRPLLIAAAFLAAGLDVAAAEPSSADVQWAQTILKGKGFDAGRPNGVFTPQTHAALGAYQRANGLPVTGKLDQATVDKMMSERASKPDATIGNMASPNSQANRQHRAEMHAAPEKPRASPQTPVQNAGGSGDTVIGGVVRSASGSPPPVASAAPATGTTTSAMTHAPSSPGSSSSDTTRAIPPATNAAPRDAVETTAADAGNEQSWTLTAPIWARYGVFGVIGLVVIWLGSWFWWSGRRNHSGAGSDAGDAVPERREPRFASGATDPRGKQPPLRAIR
ncbi:MAG: peptidoglycan-binding domain-containing protein [Azospirillaceae bacterium]|nr:peptidoglycan-binding domain-containing protein [Azospirillaceae bacterium]